MSAQDRNFKSDNRVGDMKVYPSRLIFRGPRLGNTRSHRAEAPLKVEIKTTLRRHERPLTSWYENANRFIIAISGSYLSDGQQQN